MFTKFNSKLDRSVLLSVVAMLGFNVVLLAQQLDSASLATLPVVIVFAIFQRQIIRGIALTGLKS